ncbi:AP180 N-terminal homology domain-containing protein, partial [Gaertneriomyces semiglobifer]
LNHRLRENHWVTVFKALITVHILMREGATDRVIGYVASNASILNMSGFRDRTNTPLGHEQAKNLRAYALYLEEKVMGYRDIKVDFVRSKADIIQRFRTLSIEKGLLREVELLQRQINGLLGCTFYSEEIDNVVTLQAFRLLIGDMMALFHLLNEAVIRILGEYFEMSKGDATRALQIYKNFARQTEKTVEFFEIARKLKHALGLEVPVFKHAPVSLAGALEDYL